MREGIAMKHVRIWLVAGSFVILGFLLLQRPPLQSHPTGSDLTGGLSSAKANLDLPFNAGGTTEEDEDAPEIVSFYGSMYEASAVVFCLDESKSMSKAGRWATQQKEIIRAITELSDQAQVGLVFYGDRSYSFRKSLVTASKTTKASMIRWVIGRQLSLGTCLGGGVVDSLRLLQRAESQHRAVIVAGDGRPTSCPFVRGSGQDPRVMEQVLMETLSANPGMQIRVHTILVGNNVTPRDIDFMRKLARLHRGTYRRVAQ